MSVMKVKENGKWVTYSTGAADGVGSKDMYGILKVGEGINVENGVISIELSSELKEQNGRYALVATVQDGEVSYNWELVPDTRRKRK